MRIVAGKWRGLALVAPDERTTRPSTDRNREAIASIINSAFDLDLSEVKLLDAFAGSGAIAFELLSRGAQAATLVERDRQALAAIKKNKAQLRCGAELDLISGDVFKLQAEGRFANKQFNLLVLDPPYAYEAALISDFVDKVYEEKALVSGAFVLYERDAKKPDLDLQNGHCLRDKARGLTALSLWEMN